MDFKLLLSAKFLPYIIGGIVAVLVLAGGGYYFYTQSQSPKPPTDQAQAQQEVKRLVSEVGKLIELPQGEDPTVATITDITRLKDQPFFQRAKNGDRVLIYTNARKAILYSPTLKKVIDVAPINIGTPSAEASQPKVVLRNGTQSIGLTNKVETEIRKTYPQLNVVGKENAAKSDYERTVIVVLNDNARQTANNLANILKAGIGNLATEEARPKDADILVILGKDRI